MNAFAAGHEPRDAVIGVSRGCLEYLDRDELQGVMAHEFSHILNGDMRLNLRLIGVLHGILVLAMIGWLVLRSMRHAGRSRGKGGGGAVAVILIVGAGLVAVGSIGLFFGRAIKSAVSRQREYLADASAVQFTRLPDGIAGALKKIGGRPETSKIEGPKAEEISHMFFGSAAGSFSRRLFATHPPLADRITRIDPSFDGRFPKRVEPVALSAASLDAETKRGRPPAKTFGALLGGAAAIPVDPAEVLRRIGVPGMDKVIYAAALLESIPEPLRNAAREPYDARAVIYAVLLDRDPAVRARQLAALRPKVEEPSYRETERLAVLVDGLVEEARLPLVDTTFPALKTLSPAQYRPFRENVEQLIRADDKVELLEYALRSMMLRSLDVHFGLARPPAVRHRRLDPLLPALIRVLSALAHAGQTGEAEVLRAFDKGMARVGRTGSPLPKTECSLADLDAALGDLAEAEPLLKRRILGACVACVAVDGKVTAREAALLHAVAANLGVPIPPIAAPGEETPAA
ncbi:MAG TPA: Zn-dependent protease with chaperone function [Planctomycetes bacterium]|nr:Zn-dependent protease with chaperone function [Planctomycetota bacterium]